MRTFIRKTREDGSSYALVNPELREEVREIVTEWVRDAVHKGLAPRDELYDFAQFVWEQVEEEGEDTRFEFYSEWSNFSGRMYNVMIEEVLDFAYGWDGRSLETLVLMYADTLTPTVAQALEEIKELDEDEDEDEEHTLDAD